MGYLRYLGGFGMLAIGLPSVLYGLPFKVKNTACK